MKHPQINPTKLRLRRKLASLGVFMRQGSRRGFDPEVDIARAAGSTPVRTVFDVGANVGQSALAFAHAFPQARIWSFEPFPETREHFRRNTAAVAERIELRDEAMSDAESTARFAATQLSVLNHIVGEDAEHAPEATHEIEVRTARIDQFCEQHDIAGIDFLKIDTEGSDLAALKGAGAMLANGAIRFIQVEAGMAETGKIQVPLEDFFAYLRPLGYDTFGVYEQMPGGGESRDLLRRANVVFARRDK